MVTPDGEVSNVSDETDADLMWALRGGGHNLGVVTEFTFNYESVPQHNWNLILFTKQDSSPYNTFEVLKKYEQEAKQG